VSKIHAEGKFYLIRTDRDGLIQTFYSDLEISPATKVGIHAFPSESISSQCVDELTYSALILNLDAMTKDESLEKKSDGPWPRVSRNEIKT
jgi:hypothetical protein